MGPALLWIGARELLLELIFGSAGDWLKGHTNIAGDFLSWRWSTLVIGFVILAITASILANWDQLRAHLRPLGAASDAPRLTLGEQGEGADAIEVDRQPPKVEVYYDPDPTSDFIHLAVKNNGATDYFVADLEELIGAELPQKLPWGIKWRGQQHEGKREIVSGHVWPLDLCEAFPPTPGPVVNSTKRGWFKFYSTSVPTGFPVKAGPREVLIPDGTDTEKEQALAQHDHYDDTLTLKVHVSGTSSRAASITKRVRLGFRRPLKKFYDGERMIVERVKERFLVEIDDWPTD